MMVENVPYIILNLFFVPMVSVWIHYNRSNKSLSANAEFFVIYSNYVVAISVVVKFVMIFLRYWTGLVFNWSSSYYGVLACAVAITLPYLKEMIQKNLKLRCEINGATGELKNEKK